MATLLTLITITFTQNQNHLSLSGGRKKPRDDIPDLIMLQNYTTLEKWVSALSFTNLGQVSIFQLVCTCKFICTTIISENGNTGINVSLYVNVQITHKQITPFTPNN